MGEEEARTSVRGTVSNVSGGQVAIGGTVSQTSTTVSSQGPSEAELASLFQQFATLRGEVLADPDTPDAAAEKLDELEAAITAEKPELSTMEYVRDWFVKYAPKFAGAVTALVVNPVVGALVGAAGETLATEFKRRFG
ncbi:hypothetical protein GCM10023168_21130 [Fodinibacter luteus]|uniref:Uncharacterized protein n=1 Tax=Fodinibacter luteus TaxID=552064 RepID=A0ABP8KG48_9MICO